MLSKNDDYTNKVLFRGEELVISPNEGLLSNDEINLIVDDNNFLNILIVPNSLSCGIISDIKINNDGSFSYKNSTDCLGKITFDYYISINKSEIEITSNISSVSINVIKKPATYTVKYLDYETKEKLENDKIVNNKFVYDEIIEKTNKIKNYVLVGNDLIKKVLLTDNEEIIFYYIKENTNFYIVDYYYDNVLDVFKREINVCKNINEEIATYIDKNIYGYQLDYVENLPLMIGQNNERNIINVYYKKIMGNVVVKFVDIKGDDIKESQYISNYVNSRYKTKKIDIDGYYLVRVDGNEEGVIKEEETVVYYVYDFIQNED